MTANKNVSHHYRALITNPEIEARGGKPRMSAHLTSIARAKRPGAVKLREEDWEYIKGWEHRDVGRWEPFVMPDDDEHQSLDDDATSDSGPLQASLIDDSSRMIHVSMTRMTLERLTALLYQHDLREGNWCYMCKRNVGAQVPHYADILGAEAAS